MENTYVNCHRARLQVQKRSACLLNAQHVVQTYITESQGSPAHQTCLAVCATTALSEPCQARELGRGKQLLRSLMTTQGLHVANMARQR